ncbi:MAG: hypothetical protein LUF84_03765 [Clostridiales bacterium]|nr:hypothetical protein [Clostridiales bacterium]
MNHVIKMTCLTENYPDGQKIYGVCLSYDKPIAPDLSLAAAYQVENRTVCGVSVQGCDVILSLDLKDVASAVILQPDSMPEGKKHLKKDGEEQPEAEKKPRKPLDTIPASKVVRVLQTADITAADGTVIAPDGQWGASTEVDEPLICRFQQKQYQGVNYNLYLPEGYDPAQRYPLVVFIHDAGVRGQDPRITLMQGNGALTWAKPEWQAKHPCIVVAPQVSQNSDKEIDTVKGLIDSIRATYSVDEKRVYATGQSMGCMTFCEMNIQYPDYFTASLLVAGQWDADRMAAACTGCKFWILVSNHDERAFPGMNAVVDALEQKGVTFGRYYWDAKLPPQTLNRLAEQATHDVVDMRYTVFDGSSVVPAGKNDNPVTNHVCTWPVVYEIDGVKEWLFSCVKD